jgi:hypothetical protein
MAHPNTAVEHALLTVERILTQEIAPHFAGHAKLSLLVRVPGNPAADVLITTDDHPLSAVAALARRFCVPDMRHHVGAPL